MIALALLPVGLSVLLGLAGPRLAMLVPGRLAAVLLTATALVSALSVGLVVSAIGCLAVAQWEPFAAAGHWSPATVAAHDPLPFPVDVCCALLAAGLIGASTVQLVVLLHRLGRSAILCRHLGVEHAGSLVVLDDERAEAYALAGLPGRTIVTRAMLRALSGAERRVLLAHEESHVAGYHFAYISLVQLAAAANPLLRRLVPAVSLAVERWADDDAVGAVADRGLVVTTLARAGLARNGGPVSVGALGAAVSDLHVRVSSLVEPRHNSFRTGIGVAAVVVIGASCVASSGALGMQLHNLIEWAQAVGGRSHG